MIDKWTTLHGCEIRATDGDLGKVTDFFFDTHEWGVRYFVVDTGHWLQRRSVLLAPEAVTQPPPTGSDRALPVNITKEQVKNSPRLDVDIPFEPQQEVAYREYYGWPGYWPVAMFTTASVGVAPGPLAPDTASRVQSTQKARNQTEQMRLRRGEEVKGYAIAAADGDLGTAEDYQLAQDGWKLRYMMIDTRRWLPGKTVLVAPAWIESVDWTDHKVSVDLTREQIKAAPEFDKNARLTREYEQALMAHYGRR